MVCSWYVQGNKQVICSSTVYKGMKKKSINKSYSIDEQRSHVEVSPRLHQILESISLIPKTPTTVSKELTMNLSHASRGLIQLTEIGLAILKTPSRHRGRIYGITEAGKYILVVLQQVANDPQTRKDKKKFQDNMEWIQRKKQELQDKKAKTHGT